jgi:hypothetical protein
MMSKSNLAFALESEEALDMQTANEVSLAQLWQLSSSSAQAGNKLPHTSCGKRRRTPVVFKDNHSGDFRAFRVY